ncbi:hypothetical protein [Komagataeibacter europaeus]|uniref:hypothetical protein n=1 Tax=Komagataeibacter europaeus TaxID=33995 RepID=UPI0012DE1651|nr:hypothetical protein [Komagataeibacter europaeus]
MTVISAFCIGVLAFFCGVLGRWIVDRKRKRVGTLTDAELGKLIVTLAAQYPNPPWADQLDRWMDDCRAIGITYRQMIAGLSANILVVAKAEKARREVNRAFGDVA